MERSRSGEGGEGHYSEGAHGPGLVPGGQSGQGRTSWPERPQYPGYWCHSGREILRVVFREQGEKIPIATSQAESSSGELALPFEALVKYFWESRWQQKWN